MSLRTQYHVVPDGKRWKVERHSDMDSHYVTKNDAIETGRQVAKANQPSQLVIHTANGQIETEYLSGRPVPASRLVVQPGIVM